MKKSLLIFLMSITFCFSQVQITDTILHRVKKKETLYSISKEYSVNISEIISLNPSLKDNGLKRRSRIMIPVFSEVISTDIVISDSLNINNEQKVISDLKTMVLESKNLNNDLTGITSITSDASNGNLTLATNGTGDVVINDTLTFSAAASDPTATSVTKIYNKTVGGGGTGLFFINSAVSSGTAGELISKSKATALAIALG